MPTSLVIVVGLVAVLMWLTIWGPQWRAWWRRRQSP